MEYKKVDKNTKVKKQELTTPTRKGFTVVEWGGTLINNKVFIFVIVQSKQ